MKIYNMDRGRGKTTHLVHISAFTQAPIVTFSFASKRHIIDTAKILGLTIPEPITFNEFKAGKFKDKESTYKRTGLLIDDMESMLEIILSEYFACPVLATTSSIPMETEKYERG